MIWLEIFRFEFSRQKSIFFSSISFWNFERSKGWICLHLRYPENWREIRFWKLFRQIAILFMFLILIKIFSRIFFHFLVLKAAKFEFANIFNLLKIGGKFESENFSSNRKVCLHFWYRSNYFHGFSSNIISLF